MDGWDHLVIMMDGLPGLGWKRARRVDHQLLLRRQGGGGPWAGRVRSAQAGQNLQGRVAPYPRVVLTDALTGPVALLLFLGAAGLHLLALTLEFGAWWHRRLYLPGHGLCRDRLLFCGGGHGGWLRGRIQWDRGRMDGSFGQGRSRMVWFGIQIFLMWYF